MTNGRARARARVTTNLDRVPFDRLHHATDHLWRGFRHPPQTAPEVAMLTYSSLLSKIPVFLRSFCMLSRIQL
jgi:hypothetical protein